MCSNNAPATPQRLSAGAGGVARSPPPPAGRAPQVTALGELDGGGAQRGHRPLVQVSRPPGEAEAYT